MSYQLALFAHIIGVLLLFIALGLEVAALQGLRYALTTEQARTWLGLAHNVELLFPASGLLILVAGVYMTLLAWTFMTAWIVVAFVALIALSVLGAVVNGGRFKALERVAQSSTAGAISEELRRQIAEPTLRISVYTMTGAALGIVLLMVIKPDLPGSVVTVVVAALIAGASALLVRSRGDTAATSPHTGS
jgi:hypothetical protein